jgi:DNA-binding NtrC family response regulator
MRCRIALVDDDPEFSDVLAGGLRDGGYEVFAFGTPDDALGWMTTVAPPPMMIVLDLRTPGMSAQRFRAAMMSVPHLRDIPIIVVSGHPELNRHAELLGAEWALEKPLDLDHVLEIVASHCRESARSSGAGGLAIATDSSATSNHAADHQGDDGHR